MITYPFLEGNLRSLHGRNDPVYAWLVQQGPALAHRDARLIRNPRGMLDWPMPDGEGLFRALPPDVVYKNWIPDDHSPLSVTVIVGCNLGYGLNHVLAHTPDDHRVIRQGGRQSKLGQAIGQGIHHFKGKMDVPGVFQNLRNEAGISGIIFN